MSTRPSPNLPDLGPRVRRVWRRQPPLDVLLRWLALLLLVANLVNKQAFYNQFWLVGALVWVGHLVVGRGVNDVPRRAAGH